MACASDGIIRFYHDRQSCFGAFYGESKAISPHCNVQPLPIKGFCSLCCAPPRARHPPPQQAGPAVPWLSAHVAAPRPAPPRAVSHGPSRAPQRHPACVYTQTGRNSGQQDQSAYFSVVRRLWNDPKMIQKCSKLRNWVHKCRYREQITYVSCGLLTWIMSCMFVISGSMALWQWHQWDNYLYNDCRECENVTESQWSSWWCLPAVPSPAPSLECSHRHSTGSSHYLQLHNHRSPHHSPARCLCSAQQLLSVTGVDIYVDM